MLRLIDIVASAVALVVFSAPFPWTATADSSLARINCLVKELPGTQH
jgi:hypothetical protein